MGLIDNLTLQRILSNKIFVEGFTIIEGKYLIGVMGKVQTIISVPLVLSVSLIISVVPSISAASVLKNKAELKHKIQESIEIAIKIGLPAATGIMVLAGPILTFVYRESEGYDYLMFYAASLVFIILSQSLIGILQGMTRHYAPVFIVLGSGLVKILVNILLMNTALGGYGAMIGTFIYYAMICISCYVIIKKETAMHLDKFHTFGKPILSSVVMGAVTYGAYYLIHQFIASNAIVTLLSVFIGMLIYGVLMTFLRAFTRDEITILPHHNKIIYWLEKHQLIRD
jgi:stage V sporulation protein B